MNLYIFRFAAIKKYFFDFTAGTISCKTVGRLHKTREKCRYSIVGIVPYIFQGVRILKFGKHDYFKTLEKASRINIILKYSSVTLKKRVV